MHLSPESAIFDDIFSNCTVMAITYTIVPEGRLLKVHASGEDESLEEVLAYGKAIIEAALENRSGMILCDERKLKYRLTVFDTFDLAEQAVAYVSSLVKIALVCSKENVSDGKFFETVTQNRGLMVKVTTDMEEAVAWLGSD